MSQRLGPFHILYTPYEQKQRDTIKHLCARYGIHKARLLVDDERRACALKYGPKSEQFKWWDGMRFTLKALTHSLAYGSLVGLN